MVQASDTQYWWKLNVMSKKLSLVYEKFCYKALRHNTQGYRLTFFHQEKAGPLKQNDWGPRPKLSGPGSVRILKSFQHNSFALHISLKSVFLNHINYLESDE